MAFKANCSKPGKYPQTLKTYNVLSGTSCKGLLLLLLYVCLFSSPFFQTPSYQKPRSEWVGGYLSLVYSHLITEASDPNQFFLLETNRFNTQNK